MPKNWTTENIPSNRGRTIVVIGKGGLGFENALAVTRAGGGVIIAGRKLPKQSLKTHVASRLWDVCETPADVRFGEQKALPTTISLGAPAANWEV